jgi:hypothetical protein
MPSYQAGYVRKCISGISSGYDGKDEEMREGGSKKLAMAAVACHRLLI